MQKFRNIASFSTIPSYFSLDPNQLSARNPHKAQNFLRGKWIDSHKYQTIVDPMNGEPFITVPDVQDKQELLKYIESAKECPISGLHNPLKNPQRYQLYGEVCHKIAAELKKKEVHDFLVKLIQRVVPKHFAQASGEVVVTERFFQNFSGDQPRFLTRSFNVAGDRPGQQSTGYRWPYGSCAVVAPFNFPLEIPSLQIFGALITGNKVFFKGDSRVNVVMEQMLRLALHCGLPATDVDMLFGNGEATEFILRQGNFRNTQFTGSSKVAEHLTKVLNGKIRIEDAGFDWKILGPDIPDIDTQNYVAWQSDQDAYGSTGQKCSAQSILFVHENWVKAGFLDKIKQLASTRNLKDLSNGPIITWNNTQIKQHIENILKIPQSKILFGGQELKNHSIPSIYGAFEPTALYVPLDQIQKNKSVTTELFGPFQIVTTYSSDQINQVLDIINNLENHLTAGIVSNDVNFLRYVQSNTTNGVTYSGIRARTTGAPQNHWFGPCGDPRGAGIGTPEAILTVWTCHREIIHDTDVAPSGFKGQQS
ncbi:unnamed protein product [Paramecium primaurelia]|uniref:Aldehyde dehydrogenase domain-containing protein n=1 Tax=Paramecium primaurelia TaxID=5886 RepID=A0A8S1L463_PARPR|nr:unnamed protein product [Paramecium primaurelia]